MGLFIVVNPSYPSEIIPGSAGAVIQSCLVGPVMESQNHSRVWAGIRLESSKHQELGFVAGKCLLETKRQRGAVLRIYQETPSLWCLFFSPLNIYVHKLETLKLFCRCGEKHFRELMKSLLVVLGAFSSGTTISTWLLLFSPKNLYNWRTFQVLKEQKSLTSKSCLSSK